MPKMSEKKVIFIVAIVALCLFAYCQIPDNIAVPPPPPLRPIETSSPSSKNSFFHIHASPRQVLLRLQDQSFFYSSTRCPSTTCGCAIAKLFDLDFAIIKEEVHGSQRNQQSAAHDREPLTIDFKITLVQLSGNTTDLSWSARAVSEFVMIGIIPRRLAGEDFDKLKASHHAEISRAHQELRKRKKVQEENLADAAVGESLSILAAWEFSAWLQETPEEADYEKIVENGGGERTTYHVEITLTWISDRYIGTKWTLPNRDDNPPPEEKKKKCLDLRLKGDCERFGLTVLNLTAVVESPGRIYHYSYSYSSASDQHRNRLHGERGTGRREREKSNQNQDTHDREMNSFANSLQRNKPLCSTADQVASDGAWYRISRQELAGMSSAERELIDDFVGLNRFRGGVWRWQPRECHLKWFSSGEVLKKLAASKKNSRSNHNSNNNNSNSNNNNNNNIRQITLFGDSMLLEQFHNFRKLLDPNAPVRSKTHNKLRYMSFTTGGGGGDDAGMGMGSTRSSSSSSTVITVTFIRSYTTSKGQSVIASPKVIANQVAATKPDVIIGNAAVLHWQQNMRSFDEWKSNIQNLAQRLCSLPKTNSRNSEQQQQQLEVNKSSDNEHHRAGSSSSSSSSSSPNLFYFGPTLIQMGRTQGLQPHRTSSFGEAAREAFEKECNSVNNRKNNRDNDRFTFAPFWMYNASVARRESAHDGQHWACYREWGGVAQTFTQMFFNLLLNS